MSVINVKHLTKYYGKTVGVENISFTVEKGEIFGFLGPNGAGKTTTIRLLLQLLNSDSGSIEIFNVPLVRRKVHLREQIGYLSGDFFAYPEMTVQDFLNYISSFRKNPPRLRSYLLDRFNLSHDDLHKKIKYLSHGNRQKVGLITAMEHEPKLLILDEPSIGLDPLMQEAFYQVILEFQQNGKTIFLSSHILSEVEKVCQRVAIIRDGALITVEALNNLKKKHRRRLIIYFKDRHLEAPPELPNTELISQRQNRCVYLLNGAWQPVFEILPRLPVEDIFFPEPELEDIFLDYYQDHKK